MGRWHTVQVVPHHTFVARVVIGAQKPSFVRDVDSPSLQLLSHAEIVGHLSKRAGVRAATFAGTRTAVVRRHVRIVDTRRSVSGHHYQASETGGQSDVFEQTFDDRRHLVEAIADMAVMITGRFLVSLQLQLGDRRRTKPPAGTLP